MTPLGELLGESPGMVGVRRTLARLLQHQSEARRLPPVLIQGETGTGKTELARAMHRSSARRDGPLIDVNCPAITETLQESAFFGHERGAFTDARQARPGYFQLAHRGTMFLDEVALLSDSLQGMLLKAIEERTVRRVGGTRSEVVDVWVVAASNVDLVAATRERRFREDLYHRLAVVTVTMPPLRERGDDVLLLAEHFLERACVDYGLAAKRLDAGARAALLAYDWPGNVRQVARLMERVAMLADATGVTSDMLELPPAARRPPPARAAAPPRPPPNTVANEDMRAALEATDWNLMRAARRLGIPRNTLRHRLTRAGLRRDAPAPAAAPVAPPPTPAEPEAPVYAGIRWEPRRLTLLRVALTAAASDEAVSTGRALELAADKVRAFGGHVVERSPTGLVAAFGLDPVEDAPRRAVHAAIAIRNPAARARAEGEAASVMLAVHVGRFEVGFGAGPPEVELDAKHTAWAILETLLAHADPDTVIVSEAAAMFLERRFHLERIESARPAYRLVGHERPGFGIGRRIPAFIGRRQHLDLLGAHLRMATSGSGQVIGIVGDAGIGKSRLIREFRQSLAGSPAVYREGTCFSYASAIPYLPLIAILRQTCGIGDADRAEAISAKVRRSLAELGMSADAGAPYLLQLFGVREGTEMLASLTPEAVRLRTVDTLRQMILISSRQQPIVFAVEDLHWIDKTSEDVLASLVTDVPGAAVMVVATYRPGYRPPWSGQSFASQISLAPLSPDDSLSMVRALLPPGIPDTLARTIRDKAEGNPFFLEELCNAIEANGQLESMPAVPDTIEAVLLARIDGIPDAPKSVLQTAAVLGREFSLPLLQATWDGAGALDAHLRLLTAREFLYQRVVGGAPAYVFKHALTQDVAYASLAPARRRTLHAAAGHALESLFADRLEEAYDRLAHHYAKTDDAEKAVRYLDHFAGKAARADAHDEAVQAWTEALQHVERLPAAVRDRRHLEIVLRQPYSLLRLGQIHAISAQLLQERERLERLQDAPLAATYYYLLARAHIFSGHDLAVGYARRSIAAAERCGDEVIMGKAYGVLALAGALSSEAARGIEDGHRAVALLEKSKDQAGLCYAYWALGLCCSRPEISRRRSSRRSARWRSPSRSAISRSRR